MLHWTVTNEWTRETPDTSHHAEVAVGHKVFAFGAWSFGAWSHVDKSGQIVVHVFSTVTLRWVKLPLVTSGRGEHVEVPSKRHGHTAVLIEDVIYVWGGFTYTGVHCKVLYAFHVDTNRWFKPKISGRVPKARSNHSACALGKVMYIYGGGSCSVKYTGHHINKLDTTTMVWSSIKTKGWSSIDARAKLEKNHSSTIIGTKMFVFGNHSPGIYHDYSIKVFDTKTNCWLSKTHAKLLHGRGRGGHSAFAYNGELYICFGNNYYYSGADTVPHQNIIDLWKFNPETFSWKKVETKGKGPCSQMYRAYCCRVGDRILFNDLYMLDFSPSLKTLCKLAVIQYGLQQAGLPHNIKCEYSAIRVRAQKFYQL